MRIFVLLLALFSCHGTVMGDSTKEDNQFPPLKIEIRGESVVDVDQLAAKDYVDLGARISGGNEKEAISLSYVVPRQINEGILGTYEIVYEAESTSGDTAEPATRTVNVVDIDECKLGKAVITPFCSDNADCINEPGSFSCQCKDGFAGDGFRCRDVDECLSSDTNECDPENGKCHNAIGSYTCSCTQGYQLDKDGRSCVDVDECAGQNECDQFAKCTNTEGSYVCECMEGFEGDGRHCAPEDKCQTNDHDCHEHAMCINSTNSEQGYECHCNSGYEDVGKLNAHPNYRGRDCKDIDECKLETHACWPHSHCVNTEGAYECVCNDGYEITGEKHCADVDECARETHDCSHDAECINTDGGFICTCRDGFQGDGKTCVAQRAEGTMIIELAGESVVELIQCSAYVEPGASISKSGDVNGDIRVKSFIPRELMGDAVMQTGNYTISYSASVSVDEKVTEFTKTRRVTVLPVNRCETDIEICRFECPANSACQYDDSAPSESQYTCSCQVEGYTPSYDNKTGALIGCFDNRPPVIELLGPNPAKRRACRVCSFQGSPTDYVEPGYLAYDITADGRDDLTNRVEVEKNEITENEWEITYTVLDDANNTVSVTRSVVVEYEDVFEKVDQLWEDYQRQQNRFWWNLATTAGYLAVALLAVYQVPKVYAFVSVLLTSRPSFPEYQRGYQFWYSIIHPLMSEKERARLIHTQYTKQYHDKMN